METPSLDDLAARVTEDGFAVVESVLPSTVVAELLVALVRIQDKAAIRKRGEVFAVRNLLEVSPEVHRIAMSGRIRSLVEPVLGPDFFPVRGILFDKIPGANWNVPWHQDVTIAVQEKVEVEGFGPWSVKAGILHVQPTARILERMLSVRLHLDPCGEENGALRVLPGSHRLGKISKESILGIRMDQPERICAVSSGGALLMRPLILHASSPSQIPGHRRVIHLDFSSTQLPSGLRWFSKPQPN